MGVLQLSLLRVVHKRTQFDAKLRTVAAICGPDFEVAVSSLQRMYRRMSVLPLLLAWEKEEENWLGDEPSSILCFGRCGVCDFRLTSSAAATSPGTGSASASVGSGGGGAAAVGTRLMYEGSADELSESSADAVPPAPHTSSAESAVPPSAQLR